jgi:hypothetical protein
VPPETDGVEGGRESAQHSGKAADAGFGGAVRIPLLVPPALAGLAVLSTAALLYCVLLVAPPMPTRNGVAWLGRWTPWLGGWSAIVAALALVSQLLRRADRAGGGVGKQRWRASRATVLVSGACLATTAVAIALSFLGEARLYDERLTTCMGNVMRLSVATRMYLADYDGRYPDATSWSDALGPYVDGGTANGKTDRAGVFRCPEAPGLPCAYAFNRSLGGARSEAVNDPRKTVLIFESDRGWNAAGGPGILPREGRHLGRDVYGFVDGHGAYQPRSAPLPRWQ